MQRELEVRAGRRKPARRSHRSRLPRGGSQRRTVAFPPGFLPGLPARPSRFLDAIAVRRFLFSRIGFARRTRSWRRRRRVFPLLLFVLLRWLRVLRANLILGRRTPSASPRPAPPGRATSRNPAVAPLLLPSISTTRQQPMQIASRHGFPRVP